LLIPWYELGQNFAASFSIIDLNLKEFIFRDWHFNEHLPDTVQSVHLENAACLSIYYLKLTGRSITITIEKLRDLSLNLPHDADGAQTRDAIAFAPRPNALRYHFNVPTDMKDVTTSCPVLAHEQDGTRF
jgi:hypothetical protein